MGEARNGWGPTGMGEARMKETGNGRVLVTSTGTSEIISRLTLGS